MMTRAALLLCVCAVAEGAKKQGFQKIPQFYTTNDCTRGIDPESKTWSMNAVDGVAVQPFHDESSYMQHWVFDQCLTSMWETYSVKVEIDQTACEGGNIQNQIVLYYYSDKLCGTAPMRTPLTADQCVTYSRGSVKLVTEVPLDDMCTLTEFAAKMALGGLRSQVWYNPSCGGAPEATQVTHGVSKECGAEPECEGCCQKYESCKANSLYDFNLQGCIKSGGLWRYGIKYRSYSDAACTTNAATLFNDVVEPTECTLVKANGHTGSIMVTFIPPMTIDVHCRALEVGLKYNIDPSIVSWSELNAGVAAVPHILALVAVVFAALL